MISHAKKNNNGLLANFTRLSKDRRVGHWIKAAEVKGHYLAVIALSLELVLGMHVGALLTLGFLILVISDIHKLRTSSDFSLSVENHLLADFWPTPWLVTGASVSLLGLGTGGIILASVLHLLSPALVTYFYMKLRKHPNVEDRQPSIKYRYSLALWILFYVVSIVIGFWFLEGLSNFAMQGAGK